MLWTLAIRVRVLFRAPKKREEKESIPMLFMLKAVLGMLALSAVGVDAKKPDGKPPVDMICDSSQGEFVGQYLAQCTSGGVPLCAGQTRGQNDILLYDAANQCQRSEPEDIGNINGLPFNLAEGAPAGAASNTRFCVGESIAVYAQAIPTPGITIASFDILWGDQGQNTQNINQAIEPVASPQDYIIPHEYTKPGEYIAALFITTDTGRQKQAEVAVTVEDCRRQLCDGETLDHNDVLIYDGEAGCTRAEPENFVNINGVVFDLAEQKPAGLASSTEFCVGEPVGLFAQAIPLGGANVTEFEVLWGDQGSTTQDISQAIEPVASAGDNIIAHPYSNPGEYIAALFARTSRGREKQAEVAVTVKDCSLAKLKWCAGVAPQIGGSVVYNEQDMCLEIQ